MRLIKKSLMASLMAILIMGNNFSLESQSDKAIQITSRLMEEPELKNSQTGPQFPVEDNKDPESAQANNKQVDLMKQNWDYKYIFKPFIENPIVCLYKQCNTLIKDDLFSRWFGLTPDASKFTAFLINGPLSLVLYFGIYVSVFAVIYNWQEILEFFAPMFNGLIEYINKQNNPNCNN